MFAIATILDPTADQQTKFLWDWLELNCGLSGIRVTPLPHFTWLSAPEYDFSRMEDYLRAYARRATPFKVKGSGLGLFSGEEPVLYIPLAKNDSIIGIHRNLWKEVEKDKDLLNQNYSPEIWIPHITLANNDVNKESLSCSIPELALRQIELDVMVDNLSIIYKLDDQVGIKSRFEFGKNKRDREE
jgi:2'-5' RNA ligase